MECRPLKIEVMLVAPGQVKSNISDNQAARFRMAPDSLYGAYVDKIIARMHLSQGPGAMPTAECAKQIVKASLRPRLQRYLTLGGRSTTMAILAWLPRALVLLIFWKRFSGERWW